MTGHGLFAEIIWGAPWSRQHRMHPDLGARSCGGRSLGMEVNPSLMAAVEAAGTLHGMYLVPVSHT